jgi:hypothetical protein
MTGHTAAVVNGAIAGPARTDTAELKRRFGLTADPQPPESTPQGDGRRPHQRLAKEIKRPDSQAARRYSWIRPATVVLSLIESPGCRRHPRLCRLRNAGGQIFGAFHKVVALRPESAGRWAPWRR